MLIYNDSGNTSSTSAPGNLKLDNIGFIRAHTAVSYPMRTPKAVGNSRFFVPPSSGKVTLAIYSLQGEQLYKGFIDVAAGKRYNIRQFARSKSNLPAQMIQCVQIRGAGVNIYEKVCR
jgi:hypothetical protein